MQRIFIILLSLAILTMPMISYGSSEQSGTSGAEQGLSEEDWEVVEMMDLLENIDYLEQEDVAFLENYDILNEADPDEPTGDQNE